MGDLGVECGCVGMVLLNWAFSWGDTLLGCYLSCGVLFNS